MKQVFNSNSETIHVYAQNTQTSGRSSGGNVFFENNILYSYGYHYELCRFLDKDTVLINDSGYSNSTSKHISITVGATRQYRQFYTTNTDLDLVKNKMATLYKSFLSARKPDMYQDQAYNLFESLNKFLEYTKGKTNASKDNRYKDIKRLVKKFGSLTDEKRKEIVSKRKAAKAKKEAAMLQEFLNYERMTARLKTDALRLSEDKTKVETNQGISIDIEEALNLYALIKTGANIVGYKLQYYTINKFDGKKLVAGCHKIGIEHINRVGEQLLKLA